MEVSDWTAGAGDSGDDSTGGEESEESGGDNE